VGPTSLGSVLGPAGRLVVELRDERFAVVLSQASDFDALRRSFVPAQSSGGDVSALRTP
jgi:hypothetical protein